MDLTGRTIWQIGAGDTDRDYAKLFLDWDAIAHGPGSYHPWPETRAAMREQWSAKKVRDMDDFHQIEDGHLIVLRVGSSTVLAVGEVVGPAEHNEAFVDVDGWDLRHVRRVRWLWRGPHQFPRAYALAWGETVTRGLKPEAQAWLEALGISTEAAARPLRALPEQIPREIGGDELAGRLVHAGWSDSAAAGLIDARQTLLHRSQWYRDNGGFPSEYETIATLTLPLLRALGWGWEHTAIEWRRIDVALFDPAVDQHPRSDVHLVAAIEAKRRDQSCLTAKGQAEYYATRPGREGCRCLVVTDGLRYAVHRRQPGGAFAYYPDAYVNLDRLRDGYPLMAEPGASACGGAVEALTLLRPDAGAFQRGTVG